MDEPKLEWTSAGSGRSLGHLQIFSRPTHHVVTFHRYDILEWPRRGIGGKSVHDRTMESCNQMRTRANEHASVSGMNPNALGPMPRLCLPRCE